MADSPDTLSIKGEVWADNWFALYLRDQQRFAGSPWTNPEAAEIGRQLILFTGEGPKESQVP